MAMVNALKRFKFAADIDVTSIQYATVFAVADGIAPFSASALGSIVFPYFLLNKNEVLYYKYVTIGLFMPSGWIYYTIDPKLELELDNLNNFHLMKMKSEEFPIPRAFNQGELSIVIACHSHAPLQQFWSRVPAPKVAVVMPCCGRSWSHLSDIPVDIYEDFEVYSPKRKVFLYYSSV
jgi:hypothetical protein